MVLFYDPANEADLERVIKLLEKNGIEFFLKEEAEKGLASRQIHVAEEDLVFAERLLEKVETRH